MIAKFLASKGKTAIKAKVEANKKKRWAAFVNFVSKQNSFYYCKEMMNKNL